MKTVFFFVRSHGLLISKVESSQEVQSVTKLLADLENRHHVRAIITGNNKQQDPNKKSASQHFSLMCGIETAKGVCNLNQISQADFRIEGLTFGAEDYAANIGAKRTPEAREVSYARSAVLNHSAAYELQAIDMVTLDFSNARLIEQEAQESAAMGFVGKQAIHPNQIEPIHKAFTPSTEDRREAQQLFNAFIENQILGQGAFEMKGRMIDMPLALNAAKILQKASQIAAKLSPPSKPAQT